MGNRQLSANKRRIKKAKTKDNSMNARAARKKAGPRRDTQSAMLKICPNAWAYNEEEAKRLGTDEVGYYPSKSKQVLLSPEDANDLHCYHDFKGQRHFDQSHSEVLSLEMKVAPALDVAIGPDNYPVVVNGQHTIWAIFMRGRDTPAATTVYQCRDIQSMARLYAIFDSNKKRNLGNTLDAAQEADGLIYEGKSNHLARMAQAVSVAENNFNRKTKESLSEKTSRATRLEVQEFAIWMAQYIKGDAKLTPQGVAAAFYAMFVSDRINAGRFAEGYFSGANLDADSPALYFRTKMMNRPKGQHSPTVCRLHVEQAFSAWRLFCLNKPMFNLRRTADLPAYNRWKIYAPAHEMKRLALGGASAAIKVRKE